MSYGPRREVGELPSVFDVFIDKQLAEKVLETPKTYATGYVRRPDKDELKAQKSKENNLGNLRDRPPTKEG